MFLQRREIAGAPPGQPEALIEEEDELDAVQTKLIVTEPGDAFEQEAEEAANQVMRMPESSDGNTLLNDRVAAGSKQVRTESGARRATEAAALATGIRSPTIGSRLSTKVRGRIEPVLGADLRNVQVHKDAAAQQATGALGARAFTYGNNIWIGAGERSDDVELMAHEATHVVQQAPAAPYRAGNIPAHKASSTPIIMRQGGRARRPRRLRRDGDGNYVGYRPNWSYVRARALAIADIAPYLAPFSTRDLERGGEHVVAQMAPGQVPRHWRVRLRTHALSSNTERSPRVPERIDVLIKRRLGPIDLSPSQLTALTADVSIAQQTLDDVMAQNLAHELTHVLIIIERESPHATHTQTFNRYQDFLARSHTPAARAAYQRSEGAAVAIVRLIAAHNKIALSITESVISRHSGERVREYFVNELFAHVATMPAFGNAVNPSEIARIYTNNRVRRMPVDLDPPPQRRRPVELPPDNGIWQGLRNAFRDSMTDFYRLILSPPSPSPAAPAAPRPAAARP